ncbi:hypothetical protein FBZ87_105229 [Nitrospirillum amazonense]|uniref:Uncharacterized protein n=1 Tax=Nitrospirillum amazonense TaxID=28077 RepID=A0A560JRQ7_9PROT|nr:hypothetical protein FBZ87_105229 [Nitrospirillum amazonense]
MPHNGPGGIHPGRLFTSAPFAETIPGKTLRQMALAL